MKPVFNNLLAYAAVVCGLAVFFWLGQRQAVQPSPISQEMGRLSHALERRGELKEWPDARRNSSQPGYVLMATTLEYVGGNDYDEYFGLFSDEAASAQGQKPFALIGWAMVPAPFRFENLSFEVKTNVAGQKNLRLSPADKGDELRTPGQPAFFEYLLPGQQAWGAELNPGPAAFLPGQLSPQRANP